MAAVEAVDLAPQRRQRLCGAHPVGDRLLGRRVVDVADDAVRPDPGLPQRAVGREQTDVARERAVVVRQREQRQVGPDRLQQRPDEVREVPDVEAEDERADAAAAQLLPHLLRDANARDRLLADHDLGRAAVHVGDAAANRVGPAAQDLHVLALVQLVHVPALVV